MGRLMRAPMLLAAGLLMPAQATDTMLMLACQGTSTINVDKPEPISMGLIVNFTARTISGFWPYYPMNIDDMNDVIVVFGLSHNNKDSRIIVSGSIDRISGDLDAYESVTEVKTNKAISMTKYALKCTRTQRVF
jgi:hypothetical protein